MKKHNLFKIISIMFLLVVVLTWIIPNGTYSNGVFVKGETSPAGIFDLSRIPFMTIANLLQYGIIVVLIGGFYGILNKTGAYSNLVEKIVKKFKGKEKLFLIISISALAILNSIIGLPYAFLIFVPFLIAIILKLGFNKLVALTTTIGAILVGNVASIYGSDVALLINEYLYLSLNSEILTKIIFLIILTFLLVTFVLSIVKNTKLEKNEEIPLYEVNNKKRSIVPLIVIFLISFIFILINMFDWNSVNVTYFTEKYQSLMSNTIVSNILGSMGTFGIWSVYDMCIFLVFVMLIIGWIYSVKFDDMIDGFVDGAKTVSKAAFYAIIANIIFVTLYRFQTNSNMFYTITDFIFNICGEFKVLGTILITFIGSFFYNNVSNLVSALSTPIQIIITDTTKYQLIGMIIESIHGVLMFIMPTSILLVIGLSYLNISYKDWFKHIWKFLCEILVITFIIIFISSMFIA